LGYLDPRDVSQEFLQCRVGFLDYPLTAAAKSGVFAAYSAHGVVPIFRDVSVGSADGITIAENSLVLSATTNDLPSSVELQQLCSATRAWYWGGCTNAHATKFLQLVCPTPRNHGAESGVSIPAVG
jgi:hypothetical protein